MNEQNNQRFLSSLNQRQFSTQASECWQALEQGIRDNANSKFESRCGSDNPLTPFDAWWHSCCELLSARQIKISKVDYNGAEADGEADEFIEISNSGPMIIDLCGWRINAGDNKQDLTFPEGTLIHPDQSIKIYTRKQGEFSFNSKKPIWNNKGDEALLFDSQGHLVSSWVYGEACAELITINHISYDGQQKGREGDEYIEIANAGASWVDVAGWTVSAGKDQTFVFAGGDAIAPHSCIRVYTNQVDPISGGYSFQSKKAIWNNKGDTGTLTDNHGNLVAKLSYGTAV